MDWKDAEKHMGDQGGTASSFSGEGYLGRHKAKGLSPNAEKSQVLQHEGWRFCLLAHLLWFVLSNTDITELHPSWNLTRPPHSRLLPSGSCWALDLGCRPREAWGHLLLGLRIPYQGRSLSSMALRRSPVRFLVSRGTGGEGQEAVCMDLISDSRLKSALH